MATTNNKKSNRNNNEGKNMNSKVAPQAGKNTDYTAFQKCVDGIIKDFKGDNQELEMIVAMLPVQDVLSMENIAHIIKADKKLYEPAKRKNAKPGTVAKVSTDNQIRGALLELIPAYAALVETSTNAIATQKAAMEKAKKELQRSTLTMKQMIELNKATTVKNAGKSKAELQIAAVEEMFERAIRKLYFLRLVSAESVKLNANTGSITFNGFIMSIVDDKVVLSDDKDIKTMTLAELRRDSITALKNNGVTSIRGKGKGASKKGAKPSKDTAPAQINPALTAHNNAKEMAAQVRNLTKNKDKTNLVAFKKGEPSKLLFSELLSALFIADGKLDLPAFQKAIDVATAKGAIATKVVVSIDVNAIDETKVA